MSILAQSIEIERKLERIRGQKDIIETSLKKLKWEKKRHIKTIYRTDMAHKWLQRIAQKTQEELDYHITSLVSLALETVMGMDAPRFKLNFVEKRGKTEVEIKFEDKGKEIDPMTEDGGGAVDIAAFGLRVSLWTLGGKQRRLMILDEPFASLSADLQPRAFQMVKTLSERLGIQFIIVSPHGPDISECSDKVFHVTRKEQVSTVKEIINERNIDKRIANRQRRS